MTKFALRTVLALAMLGFGSWASASFHLFRLEQIYTNADGTVQFIVLKECCNTNGENRWGGQVLRATSPAGTQTFVFPNDLPTSATANRRVLVATQGFAALGIVTPDFVVPDNFVPIGGGTINYAGVSQITFGPLPTDGTNAFYVTGNVAPNLATNLQGQSASVQPGPGTALAVEFYNKSLDHYFITDRAPEINDLDTGVHVGWERTGQSFPVFTSPSAQTSPVCRFRIPPEEGDSHFYGRGVQECNETAQKFPAFFNEDPQFFFAILPTGGTCPASTIPVYRVFDNRPQDANHRYMIDRDIRDAMVAQQHWLAEGDGPDLVVMCVPPVASASRTAPPAPAPMPADPMPPEFPPGYGGGY